MCLPAGSRRRGGEGESLGEPGPAADPGGIREVLVADSPHRVQIQRVEN